MKLITATLLSALSCYTELAAAAAGHVLTLDPSPSSRDQPSDERRTLSREAARLVIAQRAGVENYHVEKALSEDEMNAINDYGLQRHMLGANKEDAPTFILAFVEESVAESLAQKAPSFAISPAPSAPETKAFFDDLSTQSGDRVYSWSEIEDQVTTGNAVNILTGDNPFILDLPLERIEMLLEHPLLSPVTIILMPPTEYEGLSWGTYLMPRTESPLRKRQIEKPLSEAFEAASQAVEAAPMSTPLTTFAESNQSAPLRGILPACFRSQEECEKRTRNCTGHGKCRKLYHDRDTKQGGDCYSCQCSATKEDRGDGKVKTTVWGGPACQKQDVSIAFWLIALFTVGLIFVVSFAVGSVLTMGGEELPSVIGAGVSGPVKK